MTVEFEPCQDCGRDIGPCRCYEQRPPSRRDEFAKAALTGLVSRPGSPEMIADLAWRMADLMLKAE